MIKRRTILMMIVMAVAIAGIFIGYHKWEFPYGRSHSCILGMMFALESYAEENGGKYPAGEATPEADLTLLHRYQQLDANTLRGMTVPEKTVQAILDQGGLLGPETCGWHYVPGLTQADDPGIALLWCKAALGHNGQRSKDGRREVLFIGGNRTSISGDEWPGFLEKQKELMMRRSEREQSGEPLVTAFIELPDGSLIDHVDENYRMAEVSKGPDTSGSGESSGSALPHSELIWYRAPFLNGYVTRTLSFSNLTSDPVTIEFEDGVPSASAVIFKMRERP